MINPGEKISHYIIVSALGSGGMGDVYLAKDTKLERRVAIKFLHPEYSGHDDALRRFVSEAKAASSLNHPNIITIHEIGEWNGADFISMEFVEGQSLREMMNERKLSLDKTLDIVIQAGSALAAAHEAGIVHRDIKPENIMRRQDNLVKVLDFGLAKQLNATVASDGIDKDATTKGLSNTAPGFVIGTAAYMSPEQARGKPADARTDIWSLGVVLYEMISGHVPFPGETKSDMLAAILKSEPLPLPIPASELSHEFEHIIRKALGKNCEERYQVIKDLILDLKILQDELKTMETGAYPAASIKTAKLPLSTRDGEPYQTMGHYVGRRLYSFLIPLTLVIAVAAGWYIWRRNTESEATSLSSLASMQITSWKSELGEDGMSAPRLSPDGKLVAYDASKGGQSAIWLKQIDGGEPFTRRQDESADFSPLWSPDGGQIAYFSERGGRPGIWAAPALGGDSTMLVALDGRGSLIHWSKDGSTIFFKIGPNLYMLNIAAREISKLTNFDASQIYEHGFRVSPDEKRLVYVDRIEGQKDLWTASLRGENPVRLTNDAADDTSPVWHADGQRVIYNSNRNGVKQICLAFLDGRPPVQMTFSDGDSDVSDVSTDGTKILYTTTKDESDLWGVRLEDGKEFQLTSDIGAEFWQDAAPNGEAIAYQAVRSSSGSGKWFQSLILSQKINGEGRQIQLSPDGFNPRWSPDGGHLAFLRSAAGNNSLWITSAAGGDARVFTAGGIVFSGFSLLPYNRFQTQDYQWSPDSRSLIYYASRDGISNIWQVAIDGTGERQLTRNEDSKLLFFNPLFSIDGERIAWSAMTTGDSSQRIWSLWLLTGENARQIYKSESVLRLVGWSQTGRELIVKSVERSKDFSPLPGEVNLFHVALGNGSTSIIGKLEAAYFLNIALSPDRKTLAFVTRQVGNDSIQILSSAGGTTKMLISSNDARVYFSSLAWSPDGKTLYYGKQANWQVISMIENFK